MDILGLDGVQEDFKAGTNWGIDIVLKMRPSVAATDYKCCSSCLSL